MLRPGRGTNRLAKDLAWFLLAACAAYLVGRALVHPAITSSPLLIGVGLAVVVGFTLLVARANRILLLVVTGVVLAVSSGFGPLREALFEVRFLAYGVLAVSVALASGSRLRSREPWALTEPLGAMWLLAVISSIWSSDVVLTLLRSAGFALLVALLWALGACRWSRQDTLRRDVSSVVAVLLAVLLASVFVGVANVPWAISAGRLDGLLENPNAIGVVAALGIPLSVGIGLTGRGLTRVGWFVLGGFGLVALAMSGSRSGLIAVSIGIIILVVRASDSAMSKGGRVAIGIALLVSLTASLSLEGSDTPRGAFEQLQARGDAGRADAWLVSAELWLERPVVGWGFGTTEEIFSPRIAEIDTEFFGGASHSGYLQAAVDLGILGFILLIWALSRPLIALWKHGQDAFAVALLASLIAGLVVQTVESGFTAPGSIFAFVFWLIASAGVAYPTLRQHATAE